MSTIVWSICFLTNNLMTMKAVKSYTKPRGIENSKGCYALSKTSGT